MIVVRLRAGLGNQMFQYAFGRRLAIANDTELKLDTTWYGKKFLSGITERACNLPHFDIKADIATKHDLRRIFNIKGIPIPRIAVHSLNRLSEKENPLPAEVAPRLSARLFNYYWEIRSEDPPSDDPSWPYSRRFYPEILELEGEVYLAGFWESWRYFDDIASELRDDFTVVDPLRGKNKTIAENIAEGRSVGIHVRRGDKARDGAGLPPTYYDEARELIQQSVESPSFFVFSNDHSWAEANLNFGPSTTFVKHNDGTTDYEDLRLLRHCDHQIIANSSFSWWGAWLNENPDKLVYYPHSRMTWGPKDDFIPEDWIPVNF